jgi:hypothetical protein
MPGSFIATASGTIDSLTVSNLVAGSATIQQLAASNAAAHTLSVAHAFILTPQLMQATGSNSQSAAAQITTPSAVVVTVSASSRGVRLPPAAAGLTELVNNAGARFVQVFPASGDRIGAAATNASIALEPGKGGIFFAQDATTWRVILGA